MRKENLVGQRFGRLVVIELSHYDKSRTRFWKCRCDCGNIVAVRGWCLKNGATKSCGCFQKESAAKKETNFTARTNICIDCQKACGGCSWSEINPATKKPRFEPVPGWTAEKVLLKGGNCYGKTRVMETYHITACPEFVKDEKRQPSFGQCTLEQLYEIYDEWVRKGEFE